MNIIQGLPPHLPENTYVALDTEWMGINQATIHRPTTGKFACLTLCYEPGTVYFIDNPEMLPDLFRNIEDAVWVIQHAKFDITHLRRLVDIKPRKKLIDTMVMERILWNGYYSSFGLDDLCRRYLSEFLDKSLQESFAKTEEMSKTQVEYACRDADTTLRVWFEQKKNIMMNDMYVWKHIDLPALWAIMEFEGFTVDTEKWIALAQSNYEQAKAIDDALPFNPRSWQQVSAVLKKCGFPKLKNTQEDTLLEQIEKHPDTEAAKLAGQIIEARGLYTRASTYGQKFLDEHGETRPDGSVFVYSDYSVVGAETGRTKSEKPDMQNQPNERSFRECFIPRPGNVIIDADYSQQEVGIAAYISDDRKLKELYNSGQDIYIQMAKIMYDKDITKADPMRKRMKAVVLGTNYGMSAFGLAKKENIPVDEAEEIIDKFKRKFPGMGDWMDRQMKKTDYTLTVLGRRAWLNPYSNQCPRNALNNPIQGTGGDQLKQSTAEITDEVLPLIKKYGLGGIVAIPHDEIVLDVPMEVAEEVAKASSEIMRDVANRMCPGMQFRAEPKICKTWAEKE